MVLVWISNSVLETNAILILEVLRSFSSQNALKIAISSGKNKKIKNDIIFFVYKTRGSCYRLLWECVEEIS